MSHNNSDRGFVFFVVGIIIMLVVYFLFTLDFVNNFFNEWEIFNRYVFVSQNSNQPSESKLPSNIYLPVLDQLNKKAKSYIESGLVEDVSIYFEDLNSGYYFAINEKEFFTPASLTKVPTMIAVLKDKELGKLSLVSKIDVGFPHIDYFLEYPPSQSIKSGNTYTIGELSEYMIKYSDNDATQILRKILGEAPYQRIYNDLGLNFSGDQIEVLHYSFLFKVLYYYKYLNKRDSEYTLRVLSQVDFLPGLRKSIPSNILIAHKFGEFTPNNITKQLHDCGIVYYPARPYILCIMSRGLDYNRLEYVLSDVSDFFFEKVSSGFGPPLQN